MRSTCCFFPSPFIFMNETPAALAKKTIETEKSFNGD